MVGRLKGVYQILVGLRASTPQQIVRFHLKFIYHIIILIKSTIAKMQRFETVADGVSTPIGSPKRFGRTQTVEFAPTPKRPARKNHTVPEHGPLFEEPHDPNMLSPQSSTPSLHIIYPGLYWSCTERVLWVQPCYTSNPVHFAVRTHPPYNTFEFQPHSEA